MYFKLVLRKIRSLISSGKLPLTALVLIMILVSSTAFYFVEVGHQENLKYLDAVWWSLVTMTTVGYGDFFPQTTLGRFFVGIPTMLLGIAILAMVLERVQVNITQSSKKLRGLLAMNANNHIVILGYPGQAQLREIIKEIKLDDRLGTMPVCFVTNKIDENSPEMEKSGVHFIHGNPSDSQALVQANVKEARKVIILADDMHNSDMDGVTLIRILNARKHMLNPAGILIAQCVNRDNEETMYSAGAHEIIVLESLTAGLIVQGVSALGLNPVLRTLLTNERGFQFYIDKVPPHLIDISLGSLCERIEDQWENVRTVGVLDQQRQLQMGDEYVLSVEHQILYISNLKQDFENLKVD